MRFFLLLLDGEVTHLDSQSSWAAHVKQDLNLVRLSVEEFANLDYGVHPLLVAFRDGKEVFTHRGSPNFRAFQKIAKLVEKQT